MKIVFMGTPWFSVPTLELLLNNGYEVEAVYTQPDREAGRGRTLASSPVKKKAEEYNLPVEQPENFKDSAVIDKLSSYKPDLILVFSYGQILPQKVLDIPPMGCINVHPSLLPRHRGASPIISAVLAGDKFTGISIIRLVKKLDAGDILMQAQVPVADYDTAELMTDKLSLISASMILELLPRLAGNQIIPRPQNEALASYSGQLTKQDGEIDWTLPAIDIRRRIQAYNPWPGCYTIFKGKQLKIVTAKLLPEAGNVPPGQIITLPDKNLMGIGTGRGILGVSEVQLEGKRLMSAGDFIRGQRELAGEMLPS